MPSVRYVMKVTADVPWGVDGEGSLDLFVTRVRDLNQVRRCDEMCYLAGLRCVTYLITAQEIETLEDGDGQEESMVGCGCFAQVLLSVAIMMIF